MVVVARNAERYIGECIKSLLLLDYPADRYEIIVVDGMSGDGTRRIVEGLMKENGGRRIRLLSNEKKLISSGRNIGIASSEAEYVAFTDADCAVDREWLGNLASEILKAPANVVAVGGPNLVMDSDPFFARVVGYMQETFLGSGGAPQSYKIPSARYVYSIPSCNILYRKGLLGAEKYDEDINIGEDCEYTLRLKDRGYLFLYLPRAFVWHHRRDGLAKFAGHMFSYGEGIVQVSKKHGRIVRPFSVVPAIAIAAAFMAYPLYLVLKEAVWLYVAAFLVYLAALLHSTLYVYRQTRSPGSVAALFLLPLQHLAYGLGFIWGLIR